MTTHRIVNFGGSKKSVGKLPEEISDEIEEALHDTITRELEFRRLHDHISEYGHSGMLQVMSSLASDPDKLARLNQSIEKFKFLAIEFKRYVLFALYGSESPFPLPENIPEDVKLQIFEAISKLDSRPFPEWISTYGHVRMVITFREFATDPEFFRNKVKEFPALGKEFKRKVLDHLFVDGCSFP